ncbi:MAG: septation protein SepH [Rothia sp. (in: high G+C Gram-positive bacteria)]|nr:septation protein SepH [Rothia sp. (in: high G+C Gram-positive bacteria)]
MSESHLSEIRLIGIHENGEHLTLESPEGIQFLLPIDQNLRTSISKARRAQPARGFNGSGTYGPREIQARFRQGATVEEIADESGWIADRVRRYEWPIMAERAHTITAARSVLISSAQSDNTAKNLDDFIAEVAHKYGFTDAPADWNTFQQESGSWTISVDFTFPEGVEDNFPRGVVFPARWSYNPANQSIYASNESAYFLMNRDHSVDAPLPGIGRHEEPQTSEEKASDHQAEQSTQTSQSGQQSQATSSASPLGANGARNFNSARERKLADLLERARRAPVRNQLNQLLLRPPLP